MVMEIMECTISIFHVERARNTIIQYSMVTKCLKKKKKWREEWGTEIGVRKKRPEENAMRAP